MYSDEVLQKQQADRAYRENAKQAEASCPAEERPNTAPGAVLGYQHSTSIPRPSLLHESVRRAQEHQEQAVKHERAAMFLSKHPEFDEFIRLIREGVISV